MGKHTGFFATLILALALLAFAAHRRGAARGNRLVAGQKKEGNAPVSKVKPLRKEAVQTKNSLVIEAISAEQSKE